MKSDDTRSNKCAWSKEQMKEEVSKVENVQSEVKARKLQVFMLEDFSRSLWASEKDVDQQIAWTISHLHSWDLGDDHRR